MRGRLVPVLLALGAVALSVASCGVPTSQSAVTLSPDYRVSAAGPGPASTTTTTTTTPSARPSATKQLTIYLISPDGHLIGVRRNWGQKLSPDIALSVLELGPDAPEADQRLASQVPTTASMHVTVTVQGTAKVLLDTGSFATLFGPDLYEALGQVVYTLTENFPRVKAVNFFLRDPGTTPVQFNYTPAGAAVSTPVTRKTYATIAPLPPPPPKKSS